MARAVVERTVWFGAASSPRRDLRATERLGLLATFFAAYLLLDWLSYLHPLQPFRITPWNPQAAVTITLLMVCGQRWLAAAVVAVVGAELLVRGMPHSMLALLAPSLVLSFGYAAIAHALAKTVSLRLHTRRDIVLLIAIVTGGMLALAVLYIGTLLACGVGSASDYPRALLGFWIGEGIGTLVTLPLLLMATNAQRRIELRELFRRPETVAQMFAMGLALWFVFGQHAADHFRYFYLLFLPLIWMAARSGMIGAVIAAIVMQSGLMVGVYVAGHQVLGVFELQGVLIALSITGFFLGVTVDEYDRAEAELRHSLKLAAAAEMAAALAHELNQPLAAMATYARASQLLAADPGDRRTELIETLGKVGSEARRAAEVVRRLRDFFRTGARRTEHISLGQLASAVERSLRARAVAAGVTVTCNVDERVPVVLADPLQMEVVVQNLLRNALEAVTGMPEGARCVEIQVASEGPRHVVVRVIDSGPGMAPGETERIFEAFATTKATGMGVGLALSRAVVEAHAGKLWAVPGSRGMVCFTLPVAHEDNG